MIPTTQKILIRLRNSLFIGALGFNVYISCTNKTKQLGMGSRLSNQKRHKGVNNLPLDNLVTQNLETAIRSKNLIEVSSLLSSYPIIDINYRMGGGYTALILAAEKGCTEIVKVLVEKHANLNEKNKLGYTALILAAEKGYTEIVKVLVENHANLNEKNKLGYTALILAAEKGYTEIAKVLVENHANLNEENYLGDTALILATKHRNIQIKILLEEARANLKKMN